MLAEGRVVIHYRRNRGDYRGWGLHVWGKHIQATAWEDPRRPDGWDEFGVYWEVPIGTDTRSFYFIIHQGEEKDPGPDQEFNLQQTGRETWVIEGVSQCFRTKDAARRAFLSNAVGDFVSQARAYWLAQDLFFWPHEGAQLNAYSLLYHPTGGIRYRSGHLVGRREYALELVGERLPPDLSAKFPHLHQGRLLKTPALEGAAIQQLLRGQLILAGKDSAAQVIQATGVQIQGVLDAAYAYDGPLGLTWSETQPTIRLWAPTAHRVSLIKYMDARPDSEGEAYPMSYDRPSGVWSVTGDPGWLGSFYLFSVEVYVPALGSRITNLVTDPYSLSLAMNSQRSQMIDLEDPALQPEGWDGLAKPPLPAPTDAVLYELHVRDFSARDKTVAPAARGKYRAFLARGSNGINHLKRLAEAGVSHLHLLPITDNASYDEDPDRWEAVDYAQLEALPPDSAKQQRFLAQIRGRDGYNWGYDPYHFFVPEGSYASDPDGPARILETREMVAALNGLGLRVVLDVAFNHTFAAGQEPFSVLDKIVPGYYHRRDHTGVILRSSCCPNTATEHRMMEKLMRDAVMHWAKAYKVDGFRFDLMGHHLLENMLAVRADLDDLTLEEDGVAGRQILLYGEGWDFGEVAGNARGINASQQNIGGTGIGTFNDRLRDAARGGGPFIGLTAQGYLTGLAIEPNSTHQGSRARQRDHLLYLKDLIRLSLAGNLKDFEFVAASGAPVTGETLEYRGAPAGYTEAPAENILYLAAHDNETLFDAIQYKVSRETPMKARVRIQCLGLSLLALSQGIPFFHAGIEILRSKSMDRDSYRSGDWFNYLDFSYQTNNWGVGLPFADINQENWGRMKKLLADPELKPNPEQIKYTLRHFEELLQIRSSSRLFRLPTAEAVRRTVRFYNTGPQQELGLIVMGLERPASQLPDSPFVEAIVLFNADPKPVSFRLDSNNTREYRLHPILAASHDPLVRSAEYQHETRKFWIPGRTTGVFVADPI